MKRILLIAQAKSEKLYKIPLHNETKLKADKETELAGRRRLSLADFKPGQLV